MTRKLVCSFFLRCFKLEFWGYMIDFWRKKAELTYWSSSAFCANFCARILLRHSSTWCPGMLQCAHRGLNFTMEGFGGLWDCGGWEKLECGIVWGRVSVLAVRAAVSVLVVRAAVSFGATGWAIGVGFIGLQGLLVLVHLCSSRSLLASFCCNWLIRASEASLVGVTGIRACSAMRAISRAWARVLWGVG